MTFDYTIGKLNQIKKHLDLKWVYHKMKNDEKGMAKVQARIDELEKAKERLK